MKIKGSLAGVTMWPAKPGRFLLLAIS